MINVTGVNKVRPDKILYATVSSVVRPQKQIVESLIDELHETALYKEWMVCKLLVVQKT